MIFGKGKKDLESHQFKRPLESAALDRWKSVDRVEQEEGETDENKFKTRDLTLTQDEAPAPPKSDDVKVHEFSPLLEDPGVLLSEDEVFIPKSNKIEESREELDWYRRQEDMPDQEMVVNLSTVVEEDISEYSEYNDEVVPHAVPEKQEPARPPRERTPAGDFSIAVEQDIANRFGTNLKSALGSGTVIEGMFSFENPVKIDGVLRGEIKSSSALIVGPKAQVSARIQVGSLIVLGSVEGEIEAEDLIEIRKTGSLEGDVVTRRLALEEGGVFNGACTMID